MKWSNPIVLVVFLIVMIINVVAGLESESIIGGHLAKKHQFKYFVSIQLRQFHHCGGALIAPNIVLTAAHCVYGVYGIDIHSFTVNAGMTNANDDTYSSAVIKIYAHLKFLFTGTSDIALLRLEKSFDVSGRLPIGLASLPLENEDFTGKTAIVMGLGWDKVREVYSPALKDTLEFGESSGQLRYEFVDVVRTDRCDLDQKTLCAHMKQGLYGAPQGVCGGDSGGPLVYDNKVIGIVSLSPRGCDESSEPATYTKISDFLDFIEGAINDKETSDMLIKSIEY